MASLKNVTSLTRRVIVGFGVFAIISIFLQIISTQGGLLPTPSFPQGIVPTGFKYADQALGSIPHAQLKSFVLAPNTKAKYALDGKLSSFPQVANVYTIKKPRERLGNADKARNAAQLLGFSSKETSSNGNILSWQVPSKSRSLTYDKVLDKWNYKVSFEKDYAALLHKELKQESNFYSSNLFINLMNVLRLSNQFFNNASARIDYINVLGTDNYQNVASLDKAGYVKAALYKSIESATFLEFQNLTTKGIQSEVRRSDYLNGIANFIIQGKADKPEEDILDFNFHDYEYDQVGVYNTITAEDALNNIQANKGIIYWLQLTSNNLYQSYSELNIAEFRIQVVKTRLIYIEPNDWQDNLEWTHYLQPYYIFEGKAVTTDGKEADFAFLTDALQPNQYK